jgi:tetrahydromethanopterin S-methyltransferase subunit B
MKTFALIRKEQWIANTIMSAIIISSILLIPLFLTTYPFPQKVLAQQMDNKTGIIMDPETGMMMNSEAGKLMMMDPENNTMMMMDNATGMIMVMDPETGKMYSATDMVMVMDPETGKVMIKDRRCGIESISVMDILKVFTPC